MDGLLATVERKKMEEKINKERKKDTDKCNVVFVVVLQGQLCYNYANVAIKHSLVCFPRRKRGQTTLSVFLTFLLLCLSNRRRCHLHEKGGCKRSPTTNTTTSYNGEKNPFVRALNIHPLRWLVFRRQEKVKQRA